MILLLTGLSFCSKEELISGDQVYVIGLPFFVITDDIHAITCRSACLGGHIIENRWCGGSDVYTAQGVCWSTTPNPTIADNRTIDKIHPDPKHFHSILYGLNYSTTYYVRAYATNSAGITYYGIELHFSTNPFLPIPIGSISDVEGNFYKTIQIGTQTWIAENLKSTIYSDGSQISNVTDDDNWVALQTGAFRWYNDDAATYKNMYGALYNWYTVITGKLCPSGWHVPSDDEWKQLEMTLGMTQAEADSWGAQEYWGDILRGTDQGAQMKATGGWNNDWEGGNGNGTNTSGFSALPAGGFGWDGRADEAGGASYWWTSTQEASARCVFSGTDRIGRAIWGSNLGFSVRCLKNN